MMVFKISATVFVLGMIVARVYSDDHHPDVIGTINADLKIEDPTSWIESAQDDLASKLKEQLRNQKAQNLIMFLGDGWGISTITPSRILKGQQVDKVAFGEEGQLHVDTFTHSGMSKTYCTDAQTADSACSATAYLCGVKANYGTLGVTSEVPRHNCTAQQDAATHVSSILAWAQAAGKSTGIVTTTRVTHASPATTYAHSANRDWEANADLPLGCRDLVPDIAHQLIFNSPGQNFTVILGGGRRKFYPINANDTEGRPGERTDELHLVEKWQEIKKAANASSNATYIEKKEQLLRVDASKTDFLLGLFSSDHLAYHHELEGEEDPSLTDMVEKAIEILNKNPNGYVLFVEGGKIDHAHHANQGLRAMWEAVEFDRSIQKADEMSSDEQTLIVVTADHSHAFAFNGYASRGSPVTDLGGTGRDNLPFATMAYANGPGFKNFTGNQRHDLRNDDIHSLTNRQVPLVWLSSETHGEEDVMTFAKGPFSQLFSGVHEQSYIPHAMAYAACIGSGLTFCNQSE